MTTSTHQDINALLAGQGTTRRIPTWARWTAGLLIVAVGAYGLTTRPRSASANAAPPSSPGNHISTMAETCCAAQRIESGRPLLRTSTSGLPVAWSARSSSS